MWPSRRVLCVASVFTAGCASAGTPAPSHGIAGGGVPSAPSALAEGADAGDAVLRGELPWWHELKPGVYRFHDEVAILAVGASTAHHHVIEGFQLAKVSARLGVRHAAEVVHFAGDPPEPALYDLFITRDRSFLALYLVTVPGDATVSGRVSDLEVPIELGRGPRRRIGRHVYEGDRHRFLECEVEGPIANPDWGRSGAQALL